DKPERDRNQTSAVRVPADRLAQRAANTRDQEQHQNLNEHESVPFLRSNPVAQVVNLRSCGISQPDAQVNNLRYKKPSKLPSQYRIIGSARWPWDSPQVSQVRQPR